MNKCLRICKLNFDWFIDTFFAIFFYDMPNHKNYLVHLRHGIFFHYKLGMTREGTTTWIDS